MTRKHFQQFIWFKTARDSARREVDIPYEETSILPNRCRDRHGVYRVLPAIRNNRHERCGTRSDQSVTDASAEKEVGKEKSAEDRGFN
jgi:hypothetical protein